MLDREGLFGAEGLELDSLLEPKSEGLLAPNEKLDLFCVCGDGDAEAAAD